MKSLLRSLAAVVGPPLLFIGAIAALIMYVNWLLGTP